ncbi:hypothetical protein D4764_0225990 [Takifugu flavidus]|nr:hypothetical protein D4764_0225990 [Takifugu flavidus]
MSLLRRVAGLSLRDRVRRSDIWEGLGVEPLLLHIERSQLGRLGHLARMPSGRLPLGVFRTCPTGRRPRGRPRTRGRDYISRLAWERLGVPPEELMEVAGERAVWASLLKLLPPATRIRISGRKRITAIRPTRPVQLLPQRGGVVEPCSGHLLAHLQDISDQQFSFTRSVSVS